MCMAKLLTPSFNILAMVTTHPIPNTYYSSTYGALQEPLISLASPTTEPPANLINYLD